ncbi:MAG TPA: DUF3039 domain-containing protein [Candidatus Lumbricidophila sp.]|nr:DUF3039 domain-containing protein [Candidatus Lumbricidophila sp.]
MPLLEDADVIEDTTTVPVDDDGNHDRFAHYVDKGDIVKATFDGVPVTALCGKTWVANKSPEKFPVCLDCRDIFENVVKKG